MKISNNGQQHWSISQSKEFGTEVIQSLESISDAKRRQKAKLAWIASIATIKADPMTAGGPRFRYHQLDLLNFVFTNEYFVLHYAVDEARHIIYLRKFILNP